MERFVITRTLVIADANARILRRVQFAQRAERRVGFRDRFAIDEEFQVAARAKGRGDILPLVELHWRLDAHAPALGIHDLETDKSRRPQVNLPRVQTWTIVATEENDAAVLPGINPAGDRQCLGQLEIRAVGDADALAAAAEIEGLPGFAGGVIHAEGQGTVMPSGAVLGIAFRPPPADQSVLRNGLGKHCRSQQTNQKGDD